MPAPRSTVVVPSVSLQCSSSEQSKARRGYPTAPALLSYSQQPCLANLPCHRARPAAATSIRPHLHPVTHLHHPPHLTHSLHNHPPHTALPLHLPHFHYRLVSLCLPTITFHHSSRCSPMPLHAPNSSNSGSTSSYLIHKPAPTHPTHQPNSHRPPRPNHPRSVPIQLPAASN